MAEAAVAPERDQILLEQPMAALETLADIPQQKAIMVRRPQAMVALAVAAALEVLAHLSERLALAPQVLSPEHL